MTLRRWVIGAGAAAALLMVLAAGVVVAIQPRDGPAVTYRSTAGGFTLAMPGGWRVDPAGADEPYLWAEAERPNRLGLVDAWLWVARVPPYGDDPLESARDGALADIRKRWGQLDVEESAASFGGRRAIRLRYSRPFLGAVGFLRPGDIEEARYVTASADEVYEIGIGGWSRLPAEADDLAAHVRLHAPAGTRTMVEREEGFRVVLPAQWNPRPGPLENMPDAVWAAVAPPEPPTTWAILWKFDIPVDEAVANSRDEVERSGRLIARSTVTIDGVAATRIDYERKTWIAERTFFSTWLFEGPDGRAWQLLVGGRSPGRAEATKVAAGFSFLR